MEEKIKILCVDDEKNVLKALRRLFMDEDYEILTASSGEEGLEILGNESPIQVIISDYRMPGMNGVDFLQKIYERWPETIRIVLSGFADTASVVAAINEGQIYKFIPKPWDENLLKNSIAKALEVYFLHKKNMELTEKLRDSNDELQLLNENLEKLVAERTAELMFQNKVLTFSQNILDALPVAVLGMDLDGLIVQCNSKGQNVFADKGGLIGTSARDVLPAELGNLVAAITPEKKVLSNQITIADQMYVAKGCLMRSPDGQEGNILILNEKDA